MAYLLGVDEAGYGPNFGPLVISATLWKLDGRRTGRSLRALDLYQLLDQVLVAHPAQAEASGPGHRATPGDAPARHAVLKQAEAAAEGRLVVADSKLLYKPGGGLAELERSVLPLLAVCGHSLSSWRAAFQTLDPEGAAEMQRIPWYAEFDTTLPVSLDPSAIGDGMPRRLTRGFTQAKACLQAVQASVVCPRRFNELTEQHGSKGAALTELTLRLVARVLQKVPRGSVVVQCDKHGGRNRYLPHLQTIFPEYLVEVYREGREESIYRWGPRERRVEFHFVVRGERFLPAALASMTSKYLRELAMQAFNAYWRRHVPDLKPTAGYPLDANRFRAAIEAARRRLEIDERTLWRFR